MDLGRLRDYDAYEPELVEFAASLPSAAGVRAWLMPSEKQVSDSSITSADRKLCHEEWQEAAYIEPFERWLSSEQGERTLGSQAEQNLRKAAHRRSASEPPCRPRSHQTREIVVHNPVLVKDPRGILLANLPVGVTLNLPEFEDPSPLNPPEDDAEDRHQLHKIYHDR